MHSKLHDAHWKKPDGNFEQGSRLWEERFRQCAWKAVAAKEKFEYGMEKYRKGEMGIALCAFCECLELDSNHKKALARKGAARLWEKSGEVAKDILSDMALLKIHQWDLLPRMDELLEFRQLDKEAPKVLLGMGRAYLAFHEVSGKLDWDLHAEDCLKKAIGKIDGRTLEGKYSKAKIYALLSEITMKEKNLAEAARLDPEVFGNAAR